MSIPVEHPQQQPASGYVPWDDTPSLADSMSWRLQRPGERGPAVNFADTMPAELLPPAPATPFREPVDGLSVREITDDDLFVHLFGKPESE
ncbi:MAG: hypothetical protein EOP38_00385 [Rubrivivax sp.]|nr:MAG: hypothetical protein EOP38_00385 [Rubrivivax sp.]